MYGATGFRLRQPRIHKEFGQGGYTIVEVMVVLVVMSALFVAAAVSISGRQSRVEFGQAVNDIRSDLQQTINQIGSGYYARTGELNGKRCEAAGPTIRFVGSAAAAQGSSAGCIFMGQAVAFGVNSPNQQQGYVTYAIAGLRSNGGSYLTANPKAVARGSVSPYDNFPAAEVTDRLRGGLKAVSMYSVQNGARTPIGALAFMSTLGEYASGMLGSGSQQVNLMPVLGYTPPQSPELNTNPQQVVDAINANLRNITPAQINPNGGIEICFQSGGTNQSALMRIGSTGRALSVATEIKQNRTCA